MAVQRRVRIIGAIITFLGGSACREVIAPIGGTPHVAGGGGAARIEQLLASLHARVTLPFRTAAFDSARTKIANAAFLPSRVWKDTLMWTEVRPANRLLSVSGKIAEGRYTLDLFPRVPLPSRLADSRHLISLTRLGDGEYAWDTEVSYAIGTTSARDVSAFVESLLSGAEGKNEKEIRADVRATAPRASAVLAQLFRVDSIATTHYPDKSTLAAFAVTLNPAGVEARYPHFAKYMRRYGETSRLRLSLIGSDSTSFFECSLREGRMVLRVRTLNRRLVPLLGPVRPMPDTLTLSGDLAIRVRRFTVGFEQYRGEFVASRSHGERAWTITSRQEPEWLLPLFTARLLRTPLRRPFQGTGASFRIGVKEHPEGQTLLERQLHVEVQESAILRFIGRLGAIAISDYTGDAEREQYAWLKEFFDALFVDLRSQ